MMASDRSSTRNLGFGFGFWNWHGKMYLRQVEHGLSLFFAKIFAIFDDFSKVNHTESAEKL